MAGVCEGVEGRRMEEENYKQLMLTKGNDQDQSCYGPKLIVLSRAPDHGFGFTLRHFIVYPPESLNLVERKSLECGHPALLKPLDTIFVKHVRLGSSAHFAGLRTGDRIVCVNGVNVDGRTYQEVVLDIQRSPSVLKLLVISKEQDILQQVFGATAHTPESNLDVRMPHLPAGTPSRPFTPSSSCWSSQSSLVSLNSPFASCGVQRHRSLQSQRKGSLSIPKGMKTERKRSLPHVMDRKMAVYTIQNAICPSESKGQRNGVYEPVKDDPSGGGRRLERDPDGRIYEVVTTRMVESRDEFFHSSLPPYPDDRTEQVIERIKKNVEKKEEFLRRPVQPIWIPSPQSPVIKEYHVSPQKLQKPVWPPPATQPPPSPGTISKALSFVAIQHKMEHHPPRRSKSDVEFFTRPPEEDSSSRPLVVNAAPKPYCSQGKSSFVSTLSRIQENIPTPETGSLSSLSSQRASSSASSPSVRSVPLAWVGDEQRIRQLQIVSQRAKKFESQIKDDRSTTKTDVSRVSQRWRNVAQRAREFEKKSETSTKQEETPSLGREDVILRSVNRTIPIGSTRIHCEPPKGGVSRPSSESDLPERERSNSIGSQTSAASREELLPTFDRSTKPVVRQHSYLSALRLPSGLLTRATPPSTSSSSPLSVTPTPTYANCVPSSTVALRAKQPYGDSDTSSTERLVRRVSYLKATSGDRLYSDSDIDSEPEDKTPTVESFGGARVPLSVADLPSPGSLQSAVARQGGVHIKITRVDGKRAGDRSWKALWAILQGHALLFYKDRQHALQTPLGAEGQLSLRGADVEVASDYTKRPNVVRVTTLSGSELLLRAETPSEMSCWLTSLQQHSLPQGSGLGHSYSDKEDDISFDPSALPPKAIKKFPSSRTRSPPSMTPTGKPRKVGTPTDTNSSPKTKTWKRRIGSQLRKIQGSTPSVPPSAPLPDGASIGIPIEDCPQSRENDLIPLLVSICVGVVETRGLDIQGIYRIPGNRAAVTYLTEAVNRGPSAIDFSDPRWSDVHVITSLLKQFFQKLPDPVITSKLYPLFIEASRIPDPHQRMLELKRLVNELPDVQYETLHYLLAHLNRVVEHCDHNKMDVRNLAIVFGPTLIRSADDNMITMVNDMSHQCKIVESFINYVQCFCGDDEGNDVPFPDVICNSIAQLPQTLSDGMLSPNENEFSHSLLLDNINKIEGKQDVKKVLVSSIISAANRKVQKVKLKKEALRQSGSDENVMEDRQNDHEIEPRRPRRKGKTKTPVELPDPLPMSQRKISSSNVRSIQQLTPSDELREFDPNKQSFIEVKDLPAPITEQNASDELAIRSYAGLSASTQERIRKFEQETKAMLQRDLNRHKVETQKREENQQRIEEQWLRAKQDLENEDIFDHIADNPSADVQKMPEYNWHSKVEGDMSSLASLGSTASSDVPPCDTVYCPSSFTTNHSAQVANSISNSMSSSFLGASSFHNILSHYRPFRESLPVSNSLDRAVLSRKSDDSSLESSGYCSLTHPAHSLPSNSNVFANNLHSSFSSPSVLTCSDLPPPVNKSHSSTKTNVPRGKYRDTLLHHIIPTRLYPSPRPVRRGSSDSVTGAKKLNCRENFMDFSDSHEIIPQVQISTGLGTGGESLDSLKDASSSAVVDGGDLLSAITATFEEKMKSFQEISSNLTDSEESSCDSLRNVDRLFRDPSLHRRRTSKGQTRRSPSPQKSQFDCKVEDDYLTSSEMSKTSDCLAKIRDGLTILENIENNHKEKSEKRAREMRRTDTQESLLEKKPKEMKRSDIQESSSLGIKETFIRKPTDVRNRRHNVKELKEKFELPPSKVTQTAGVVHKASGNGNKPNKFSSRKNKGSLKRRHTVGGTKDLVKLAWLQALCTPGTFNGQAPAGKEGINQNGFSFDPVAIRERLQTSSPDLTSMHAFSFPLYLEEKENIHKRLSIQEVPRQPLCPLLESHV